MKDKNKNRLMKAGILAMLLGMSGGQAWAAVYQFDNPGLISEEGKGQIAIEFAP